MIREEENNDAPAFANPLPPAPHPQPPPPPPPPHTHTPKSHSEIFKWFIFHYFQPEAIEYLTKPAFKKMLFLWTDSLDGIGPS